MSEYAIIKVQRYRTPAGVRTCASGINADETCEFMKRVGMRGIEICGVLNGSYIDRSDGAYINRSDGESGRPGCGYTIPLPECPVWADEAAK